MISMDLDACGKGVPLGSHLVPLHFNGFSKEKPSGFHRISTDFNGLGCMWQGVALRISFVFNASR